MEDEAPVADTHVALLSRVEEFEQRLNKLSSAVTSVPLPMVCNDALAASASTPPYISNGENATLSQKSMWYKEGTMKKKGGGRGGRRNWTTRWFKLGVDCLAYFKTKTDNPKGVISLHGAVVDKWNGRPFGIVIKVASRDYLMCASDSKEQADWIVSIQARISSVKSLLYYNTHTHK